MNDEQIKKVERIGTELTNMRKLSASLKECKSDNIDITWNKSNRMVGNLENQSQIPLEEVWLVVELLELSDGLLVTLKDRVEKRIEVLVMQLKTIYNNVDNIEN